MAKDICLDCAQINELKTEVASGAAMLARQNDRAMALEERVAFLEDTIRVFCAGQSWAAPGWKNQEHVKPLFDICSAINKP